MRCRPSAITTASPIYSARSATANSRSWPPLSPADARSLRATPPLLPTCLTCACQAGARRWVFDRLRAANLGVNVHYIPVYRQPYYRDNFPFPPGLCPNAERYYREAITLPLYPGMTDAQVEYVIATVRRVALELQETLARAA